MAISPSYQQLERWLNSLPRDTRSVTASFSEIEKLIGRSLPASARKHQAWWSNSYSHSQATAWLEAAWRVARADLSLEEVSFGRNGAPSDIRPRSTVRPARVRAAEPDPAASEAPRPSGGASVVLVACAGSKLDRPGPAKELYVSALFEKSRAYAERFGKGWFILSAKHGLLHPEEVIEPYDLTLKNQSRAQRRDWAGRVAGQLLPRLDAGDKVVFLAGVDYRQDLTPILLDKGHEVEAPMTGLGIGKQLQWLSRI